METNKEKEPDLMTKLKTYQPVASSRRVCKKFGCDASEHEFHFQRAQSMLGDYRIKEQGLGKFVLVENENPALKMEERTQVEIAETMEQISTELHKKEIDKKYEMGL